jgi:catechol 2,3-dioxygenase-like lactoylglutathione lyase family enzyme
LKIGAVVETAIYVDDLQAAETFYGTALDLRVMGKEPGRVYGAFWDMVIEWDGKRGVKRSSGRYLRAIGQ